jgi:hypothetical protein
MSALKEMSVEEAASKALAALLTDGMEKYIPEGEKMSDYLSAEWSYPEEDLSENGSAWHEIKMEGSTGDYDGFTAKVVAEYGGEGQGDAYWVVVSISDGETARYFRRDGWYASYDGGNLDGPTTEVAPQEKMIVVYE